MPILQEVNKGQYKKIKDQKERNSQWKVAGQAPTELEDNGWWRDLRRQQGPWMSQWSQGKVQLASGLALHLVRIRGCWGCIGTDWGGPEIQHCPYKFIELGHFLSQNQRWTHSYYLSLNTCNVLTTGLLYKGTFPKLTLTKHSALKAFAMQALLMQNPIVEAW